MLGGRLIVRALQRADSKLPSLLTPLTKLFANSFVAKIFPKLSTLKNLIVSTSLDYGPECNEDFSDINVGLLYVAHQKDFHNLEFSLKCAIDSLRQYSLVQITIIVPDSQIEACKSLLKNLEVKITIMAESEFMEKAEIAELQSKFIERRGWALQQILKLKFVMRSQINNWLVVDADTFLLRRRNWIDRSGRQILMQSWESHDPYYQFLEHAKLDINRNFSFITHHMFYQKHLLCQALAEVGVHQQEQLVPLTLTSDSNQNSGFSIDYELYGQYLLNYKPEFIRLEKWSNISIDEKVPSTQIAQMERSYASVSLHDYLAEK